MINEITFGIWSPLRMVCWRIVLNLLCSEQHVSHNSSQHSTQNPERKKMHDIKWFDKLFV